MKKRLLVFLKKVLSETVQNIITQLKEADITILSQYEDMAIEVEADSNQQKQIKALKNVESVHDKPIAEKKSKSLTDEKSEIIRAWNMSLKPATKSRSKAFASTEGVSWGDPRFDAPKPYTKIPEEAIREALKKKKISIKEVPATRSLKKITQKEFRTVERELQDKLKDETKVYHFSRLVANNPDLKETILDLSTKTLDTLFKELTAKLQRGPEESCWKMNGSMSVGVVFVESSKTGGPKFTATERTTLRTEIQTGLNWLASQHPAGNLNWVFNYQYTSINVNNGTNSSSEDYWRNPAMAKVSYNGNTYAANWNSVAQYREHMRTKNNSAHAIVIFVTPFATEWHAYASGSRLTLANRNNWGGWGINVIDTITAHEVCHLYGAADEYTGSGTPCTSCTTKHGCDQVANGNCKACAGSAAVPCVMDQNALTLCSFTRGQIGWPRWRGWEGLDGIITSKPNAVSWGTNRIDVVARGTDSAVHHKWWDGSQWRGWEKLGGQIQGAPAICSWASGRLDIFATGMNHHLYHMWFQGKWSGWEDLGGLLSSEPTAVSWSNGRIDVFARGLDSAMYHKWFQGSWSGWENLGGVLGSAPAVSSWAANRLDCFVAGMDHKLYHKWWNGSAWSGWENLGGTVLDNPGAVSWGPNRIDVFYPGTNFHMMHKWWDGSAWKGEEDLGGILSSGVGVSSWQKGRVDCFVEDLNSAMSHLWYS